MESDGARLSGRFVAEFGVASSHLPLHIFVEFNTKGFNAECHEHGTAAYIYRFQYPAGHTQ
jgi:hypothetical protein